MKRRRRSAQRSGFTLLEALLAVGVFAGSMAMVVQLMRGSATIALRGNLEVMAAERCQSMIDEILCSGEAANAAQVASKWCSAGWRANVRVVRTDWPGIVCVHAMTEHADVPELSRFELTRLVPENRIATATFSSISRGGE